MDWESMRDTLTAHGQEHLLRHLDSLSTEEQQALYSDLSEVDFPRLSSIWEQARITLSQSSQIKDDKLKPLDESIVGSTGQDTARWMDIGLEKVANNEVAVLLLAGGQGTRLNVSYPKGMYDVQLPSHKTLYQLQAERVLRLQTLARSKYGKDCVIPWYIMTSEHTMAPTEQFFKEHSYFGLKPDNVTIFEQKTLPCVDFNGKILLSAKHRLARAPDGNGGLYSALAAQGNTVLSDMRSRGVNCVHVYCVDNILVRMADPIFVGFCNDKGAECGAKVVKKVQPTERVGVVCCYDDHYQVVEYSEISSHLAELKNDDGSLTYNAGNICNHFFTVDFLDRVCREHTNDLIHHVAKKKIAHVDNAGVRVEPMQPNGIKLEKFIFDVFAFARSLSVLEVCRSDEFSPVKNAPGAPKDTPETARADLLALHLKQVLANGGTILDTKGSEIVAGNGVVECEISPLVSYGGEGLEALCSGHTFTLPVHLDTHQ